MKTPRTTKLTSTQSAMIARVSGRGGVITNKDLTVPERNVCLALAGIGALAMTTGGRVDIGTQWTEYRIPV